MSRKVGGVVALVAVGLVTIIGFQNCSNSFSPASRTAASTIASCKSQSILRNAYPRGNIFSIPAGSTLTPTFCENRSEYKSLVFDPNNQTVTLTGDDGASKNFVLDTGGDGCSAGVLVGGDRWRSFSGEFLDTALGEEAIQINHGQDISCTVPR